MAREFESPGAFAAFLATLESRIPEARKKGLEAAGKLVKGEIQDEMGHYQGAIHGLPEWAPLAERTVDDRVAHGYTPNDPLVRSGELRATIGYTVHDDHVEIGSPDKIMEYQEFGTPDARFPIPPRPVIGGSLFRRLDDAVKAAIEPTIKLLEGEL